MVEVGGSNPPGHTKFLASVFIQLYFFEIVRFDLFLYVDTTAQR